MKKALNDKFQKLEELTKTAQASVQAASRPPSSVGGYRVGGGLGPGAFGHPRSQPSSLIQGDGEKFMSSFVGTKGWVEDWNDRDASSIFWEDGQNGDPSGQHMYNTIYSNLKPEIQAITDNEKSLYENQRSTYFKQV